MRYIFVGFTDIDVVDPWNGSKRKVSYFSTYLSFPWLTVVLKNILDVGFKVRTEGALSDSQKYDIISTAVKLTTHLGDYFAPHGLINLIDRARKNEYINALQEHYEKYKDQMDEAIWMKGQNIYLNLDGTVNSAVSVFV